MIQPEPIYSIFVSSTSEDLASYRARARDVILTYNLRPLGMEYFPAESGGTTDALHRYLDAADGVVLIAGARYGSLVDQRSYVEWEFEQALARRIPVVCLVMADEERMQNRSVTEEEREKQENFIQRLRKHSKVAQFNKGNFDLTLSAALSLFPMQFRSGAGLIRVADYNDSLELASSQLRDLRTQRMLLRLLSGIGLIYEHGRYLTEGDSNPMKAENDRVVLDRLLDLLYQDLANRQVTTRIIERLVRHLIEQLHGFSGSSGFIPESLAQLEVGIDELFGETLSTLKATSIHSNHDALATYKGYWQDSELGPFFKHKNEQFLAHGGDRRMLRVYACDSVASSVGEAWFAGTIMQQVKQGAAVKVVQIDVDKVVTYEDFGIYEHGSAQNPAGTYLLLAPRERNMRPPGLTTSIIADHGVVAAYSRKFETLWGQSAEPLEIMRSTRSDEADRRPLTSHGSGSIRHLFDRRVVLRRMERLDTMEELLPPSTGFVRKYQFPYAKAISSHLKMNFPNVRHLLYVGDTHMNDGTLIRNLQTLGWDMTGFVCEPKLGITGLWFNNILYTSRWTDLVGFAEKVSAKVGPNMLAFFDIDQTLWAPKGVHEGPLSSSRIRAMSSLIDRYVVNTGGDVAILAKARIAVLYREISEVKYLDLTLDNEDFKAAICIFLALNLVFNQRRLEIGSHEAGAAFFEELGRLDEKEFLKLMRTYVYSFARPAADGEANITRFIMETVSAAQTYQYALYAKNNEIRVAKIVEDLQGIFRETVGNAPIQYATFRAQELKEVLSSVGGGGNFDEELVLSKPAWDVATWLKRRGVSLFALSDRPDESTVSPAGESLLDANMTIYGKDISGLLADS